MKKKLSLVIVRIAERKNFGVYLTKLFQLLLLLQIKEHQFLSELVTFEKLLK